MALLDTSQFPFVLAHTKDATTLSGVQALIGELSALLARQEKFGIVLLAPNDRPQDREKGVNAALATWMKENRPRIAAQCVALASVVSSTAQYAIYKPLVKLQGARMYGCPTDIFRTLPEAENWVREQLRLN